MNKNVDQTCGQRQAKDQPGLRGMSLTEIEKMIKELVKSNSKLTSDFTILVKGKVPKGESRRLLYCAFMKRHFANEWAKYSKGKEVAKPVEAASVPKEVRRMLAKIEGENLRFNSNNEVETGNIENNNGAEGGNYANENNQPMKFTGFYERARRTVNKDPLKGAKLSRARLQRIKKQLRDMKKAGMNIPEFANQNAMVRFALLRKPTAPAPKRAKIVNSNSNSNNEAKPVRRAPPLKRMRMTVGGTARTARVPAGSKVPVASANTRLSRNEIRAANALANQTAKAVILGAGNRAFVKEILSARYTNADANMITNRLMAQGKFNYDSVRNVIRPLELNRATVLRDLGSPIVEPAQVAPSKPPVVYIRQGNTLEELATEARKKKVNDRSANEKLALRVAASMAGIRKRIKAGRQRAAVPVITTRPINLNSNKNSNNNMGSPVMRSPAGSNSNSNSNSNNTASPKIPVAVVEAKRVMNEKKAEPTNNVRPIPRSLTGIAVKNGVTKFRGQNVNAMNKGKLVNVAKRMYAYLKPNEVIPFENANVSQVRKLVKSGAKKILAVK